MPVWSVRLSIKNAQKLYIFTQLSHGNNNRLHFFEVSKSKFKATKNLKAQTQNALQITNRWTC